MYFIVSCGIVSYSIVQKNTDLGSESGTLCGLLSHLRARRRRSSARHGSTPLSPEAPASIVRLSSSNFASICFACKGWRSGSKARPRAAEFGGRVNLLERLKPVLLAHRTCLLLHSSSVISSDRNAFSLQHPWPMPIFETMDATRTCIARTVQQTLSESKREEDLRHQDVRWPGTMNAGSWKIGSCTGCCSAKVMGSEALKDASLSLSLQ